MNNQDDSICDGTYEQKLRMVADELMAPEEIGLVSADDARIKLAGDAPKKPVFGTSLLFRAGAVPLELRAEWAIKDTKIVMAPSDAQEFKSKWMEEHKNEFPIQGELLCGTAQARFGQTFKDPILGLCMMLRQAADLLESKYTEGDAPEGEASVKDFVPDVQAAIASGELPSDTPEQTTQQDEPSSTPEA